MRTRKELEKVRSILHNRILEAPSREQKILLLGMLQAVLWTLETDNASTFQRVIDGEQFRDDLHSPELNPEVFG